MKKPHGIRWLLLSAGLGLAVVLLAIFMPEGPEPQDGPTAVAGKPAGIVAEPPASPPDPLARAIDEDGGAQGKPWKTVGGTPVPPAEEPPPAGAVAAPADPGATNGPVPPGWDPNAPGANLPPWEREPPPPLPEAWTRPGGADVPPGN